MKKQKSTKLKKLNKIKRNHKKTGIKKGGRDNSCNDIKEINSLSNNKLLKKKLKDAEEEVFHFKSSLYYAALTFEGFPEITKKILYGHIIKEEEINIISNLAENDCTEWS